ncbi:MAG TPA: ABC transporter permease [Acidimicrobiales bacterium]|nr:ABC transporter permease [Acidimicrobiales bacterium]
MIQALVVRSVVAVTRIPSAFIPSVIFPVFQIVAFGGAFSAITMLPGFPTDQVLNWFGPMAVLQGSAFLGSTVGLATTRDIETGFYDRLLLAPAPRWSLLVGPVAGAVIRTLLPIYVVLTAAALGGARLVGSALGAVTLLVAAVGLTALFGFWTLGLAFRFKSQRAAPLMQIGVFISIFLATAQVPLAAMTGWLHAVARVNPMSNVLRLARVGFLGEVTWEDCWGGLLALAVGTVLTALFAARQFRQMVP